MSNRTLIRKNDYYTDTPVPTGSFLKLFDVLISGINWKFKLLVFGGCLAFFVSPPSRSNVHFDDEGSYWPTVEQQAAHPFQPIVAHAKSHAANKAFRLTVPILAKVLNLDRRGIFLVQASLIVLMMWLVSTLGFELTQSKELSALLLISLIPLYPIICAYQEGTGHLDAFAYCFILLSMFTRKPWLIFLFCFFAAWCDERAFVATSLVFVWWYIQKPGTFEWNQRSLTIPNSYSLAVVSSWIAYFVVRMLLMKYTALHIAMEKPDLSILPQYLRQIPLLTFLAFGGLWVLPICCFYFLARRKKYLLILTWAIPMTAIFSISSMVWDFTRSISFLLPAFFISLLILVNFLKFEAVRSILYFTAICSVTLPCFYFDSQLNYIPSLPYDVIEYSVIKVYQTLSL